MEYTIKYWEENTDFEELKNQIGDRKIAVWGAYIIGEHVRKILKENGLEIDFYIDGHKDSCKYENLPIIKPSEAVEKTYIFVAVFGVREEIV